ncbi:nitroreductase/quinone reductase family protein [Granulicoccus sp. GXG6511]|uniref:nitroreductase/quinone reductase family protein n=1 Tax=Granulicoccus sp. GXG6511 TaxID=3381351 RepID=UPI003D7DD770
MALERTGRRAEEARNMYVGGRGDRTARAYARAWALAFGKGLMPKRWVTLEVPGRKSGRMTRFPLGMADWEGRWFLVSMLGECNWTRNVRAAGGRAVLRRRKPRGVLLNEVPTAQRAPIIKRYLAQVPGARPHVPVDRRASLAEFEAIAGDIPVFEVCDATHGEHR